MPRLMHGDEVKLYRARYTIIYPVRDGETEPHTFTQYFGPYGGPGPTKAAINVETNGRSAAYYEREGIKIDTEIEVADISWRPYHDDVR